MKVLISGSSGFIGKPLVDSLKREGNEVYRLVRGIATKEDEVSWDIKENKMDVEKLERIQPEVVIHLAGEPLMSPGGWTEAKKKDSRVNSTGLICDSLLKLSILPRVIISSSGISYYGNSGDKEVDETSGKGSGFLSDCTVDWENRWDAKGVPVFTLRTGIVLNPAGGALASMKIPFYFGFGGVMGSGKQWVSWISLWDAVRIFLFIINDINGPKMLTPGPINTVGPKPVQNYEFAKTLGRVMWRPAVVWMPEFVLKLAMGEELVDSTVLSSTRVIPRVLVNAGFTFCDNTIEEALRNEFYTRVTVSDHLPCPSFAYLITSPTSPTSPRPPRPPPPPPSPLICF